MKKHENKAKKNFNGFNSKEMLKFLLTVRNSILSIRLPFNATVITEKIFSFRNEIKKNFMKLNGIYLVKSKKLNNINDYETIKKEQQMIKHEFEIQKGSDELDIKEMISFIIAVKKGDFSVRLPFIATGITGKIYGTLNDIVDMQQRLFRKDRKYYEKKQFANSTQTDSMVHVN